MLSFHIFLLSRKLKSSHSTCILDLQAVPPMFAIDDEVLPDVFESQKDPDLQLLENPNLLSVNQFLDWVLYQFCLLVHF